MPSLNAKIKVNLTAAERSHLQSITRQATAGVAKVRWAKILLLADESHPARSSHGSLFSESLQKPTRRPRYSSRRLLHSYCLSVTGDAQVRVARLIRAVFLLAMTLPASSGKSVAEERFVDDNNVVVGDMDLLFAPGDACFPFHLNEETVLNIQKGPCVLSYRAPPQFDRLFTPGMGYSTCEVEFDNDTRGAVSEIYKKFRRRFLTISHTGAKREINPMYGFVYPEGVDVSRIQIGWRYNEHWQIDAEKLLSTSPDSPRIPVRYSTYALDVDGVISELFHARNVPPLPTMGEDTLERGFRTRNQNPVRIEGKFKIIVVPEELIEDLQQRKRGCAEYAESGTSARFFVLDRFSDAWVDCSKEYSVP